MGNDEWVDVLFALLATVMVVGIAFTIACVLAVFVSLLFEASL